MSKTFTRLQKLLPQHALSRLIGRLADSENDWLRRAMIHSIASLYNISLADARRGHLDAYRSFNDFFTRELKPGTRPMPDDKKLVACPVDGTLSQFGEIHQNRLYQAKGKHYSLDSLLGRDSIVRDLDGGWFATLYLAPSDYHRVHMPCEGRLLRYNAIPGELFSVNAMTTEGLPDLFCRNERLVCVFDSDAGPLVVVLVGALIVASIETVWKQPQSPYREFLRQEVKSGDGDIYALMRGQELGRFRMGSTVILCFPPHRFSPLDSLRTGQHLQLGTPLGRSTT